MDIKDLKLQKVTDRIYYLPNLEAFDWPTLGIVIGDKHTLMLDSGRSGLVGQHNFICQQRHNKADTQYANMGLVG